MVGFCSTEIQPGGICGADALAELNHLLSKELSPGMMREASKEIPGCMRWPAMVGLSDACLHRKQNVNTYPENQVCDPLQCMF